MRKMHWSQEYVTYIGLEIPYDDGAVQGWGYECKQYESVDTLRQNMQKDFFEPRLDRSNIIINLSRGTEEYSTEIPLEPIIRDEFVEFIFAVVDGILNGN